MNFQRQPIDKAPICTALMQLFAGAKPGELQEWQCHGWLTIRTRTEG